MMKEITARTVRTPLGKLVIAASDRGLLLSAFAETNSPGAAIRRIKNRGGKKHPRQEAARKKAEKILDSAQEALNAYFSSTRLNALDKVALDLDGTEFQLRVWRALRAIPAGQTLSYRQLAHKALSPLAARAAGQACGANPLVLFVPCHRAIAASGALGGFSAKLWRKRKLLALEKGTVPTVPIYLAAWPLAVCCSQVLGIDCKRLN
jgi:O-6-methylguanine DNA methyltransferase